MGAFYNKFPFVVIPRDMGDDIVYTAYRYFKTKEDENGDSDPIFYLRTEIIGGQMYGQMGRERASEAKRKNLYYKRHSLDDVAGMLQEDAYRIITQLVPKAKKGVYLEGQIILSKSKK
jgi:hypothetical protein